MGKINTEIIIYLYKLNKSYSKDTFLFVYICSYYLHIESITENTISLLYCGIVYIDYTSINHTFEIIFED